jgi:hypothetical protein
LENPVVPEKHVLNRQEAADYLGVHIHTLDKSDIPRIRIADKVLFRKCTLDKFLAEEEKKWTPKSRCKRGRKCRK